MNRKTSTISLFIIAVLVIIIMIVIGRSGAEVKEEGVKIGYVMTGGVDDTGWNSKHYEGVKAACDELGAELIVKEHVEEYSGDCRKAVAELIDEDAQMIILGSYSYSEEALELIKSHPKIAFYGNSSEYHEDNLSSYFTRMYEARYLAGIVAGMETKSGEIGYVAAMPNNEVNRGISAFTLGVRSVNPQAKVWVGWTGEWENEEKEKTLALNMARDTKVDVMTYHQNQPYVAEVAELLGIKSIGYHEYVEGFSDNYLTAVVSDWKLVYTSIIKEFLQGKGNSTLNYWIGIEEGAVDLASYSEAVSEATKAKVEETKTKLSEGWDVFTGDIKDQQGKERCKVGESIGDKQLLENFDWLVEGVEVYE